MINTAAKAKHQVPTAIGALLLLALLTGLNFSSLQSMWRVWGDSNTYTHGYLVFPMVAYLVYLNRGALSQAPHKPFLPGAVGLIVCGLIWVLAELLNVHVIGQLMFVAMIALLNLSYFGLNKTVIIMFPLAYLFFAVPMGEGLVPVLMNFTADFTVWALRVTGLPVFRDGMFFSIPAGDFEVAKACSGIRYLMASFALGTLYAYLSFRSFKKQLIFSVMSLLVPIFANGLRAYGIVMIAHLSNMKYAVGVDHLVYGWLFFGLVMFLLFYFGGKFRSSEDCEPLRVVANISSSPLPAPQVAVAVAVLAAALVLPHTLSSYVRFSNSDEIVTAALPVASMGWSGPGKLSSKFEPDFSGAIATTRGAYRFEQSEVYVWVFRYPAFDSQHEMVTETNTLADIGQWAVYQKRTRSVRTAPLLAVIETDLGDRRNEYTTWHWYQLNDTVANGRVRAKIAEVRALLSGTLRIDNAIVVLATPERGADAIATMERFTEAHGTKLVECARAESSGCLAGGF